MKYRASTTKTRRMLNVSGKLILEQLREPTALIWTTLSPSALFIFILLSKGARDISQTDYIDSASWFYAYISFSVAFFGLSFYLIGRRESGFVRSFAYHKKSIHLLLGAYLISYSVISILHASIFYILTRPLYGSYNLNEYTHLITCFYISYLAFSCAGLLLSLLPLKFTTTSTLYSALSFLMLTLGYMGAMYSDSPLANINVANPLAFSTRLFIGTSSLPFTSALIAMAFSSSAYITARYFRVQPVWSRY